MVPNDSDEQLGARLDSALRASLGSDQVDVDRLLVGSRGRAHRLRTQRISLVVAAAVLMIGVPAGLELSRPNGGEGPPAVMLGNASSATSAPGSSRFLPGELPAGLKLVAQSERAELPIVAGQSCDPGSAPTPLAGRQWAWQSRDDATHGLGVQLTVSKWTPGTAARPFDDLVQGTGGCTWTTPQTMEKFTDSRGLKLSDETWSTSSVKDGVGYGRAVVRVGDWIAGVEVRDPRGRASAVQLAQELAGRQARRYSEGSVK
jgi:hypothetical protein